MRLIKLVAVIQAFAMRQFLTNDFLWLHITAHRSASKIAISGLCCKTLAAVRRFRYPMFGHFFCIPW